MVDALRDQALAHGAKRVVVLNMPDVARTPRFTGLLARLADVAGAPRATAAAATADAWAGAYNARLAQRAQAHSEIAVVDFHALLDGWIDRPQAAGFTDVTTPACPATGTDEDGLPTYDLRTCTEASLSASPPQGASADWWRTYLFADHFHGTPRMNEQLADEVLRVMSMRGWR
jgi:phospholipase/lecithinase/hemolysin